MGGRLNVPGDSLCFSLFAEAWRDYRADPEWTGVTETITLSFGHYPVGL